MGDLPKTKYRRNQSVKLNKDQTADHKQIPGKKAQRSGAS